MPKVSIIFTSFNHGKYLCESIDSVLNQTYLDFELIILDDASSDNSWDLICQYSDPRIKKFQSTVQGEVVYRMNDAISRIAAGEYIAVQHSDDVWELDKLEKQLAFMEAHPEVGAVFTNAIAVGEDSVLLADRQHFYSDIFNQPNRTRHEWLRFFFSRGNALCHPSVLIRKVCYENCGLYRHGLNQLDDFDMWIRLCLKHEIHVLPEKLVRFRVRDNEANVSGNRPEVRIRGLYEFYKLLQNYRRLQNFDDLVKVFPDAEKFYRGSETDTDFVLAMIALEDKSFACTQLFGLDIVFELISDNERAAKIKRLYDFDSNSFIALTAQHDVFSREKLAFLYGQLNATEDAKAKAETLAIARHEELDVLVRQLERTEQVKAVAEELAHAHLSEVKRLQVQLNATEDAKAKAETLAIARHEELDVLVRQLERTEQVKAVAEELAHAHLSEVKRLQVQLNATEDAKAKAETLAIARHEELDVLVRQLERTEQVKAVAEELAHAHLSEVKRLQVQLNATEDAKAKAETLAIARHEELDVLVRQLERTEQVKAVAEELAHAHLSEVKRLQVQLNATEDAKAKAEMLAITLHIELNQLRSQLDSCEKTLEHVQNELDMGNAYVADIQKSMGYKLLTVLRLTPKRSGSDV